MSSRENSFKTDNFSRRFHFKFLMIMARIIIKNVTNSVYCILPHASDWTQSLNY